MKNLVIVMVLVFGGIAQAAGTIYFRHDGLPVTSVQAGSDPDYVFLGTVPVKSDYVDFCLATAAGDYCIQLLTDNHGFYAGYSPQDPSGCQFQLSDDLTACDYTPRTLNFSVQKQGTGRALATGSLALTN